MLNYLWIQFNYNDLYINFDIAKLSIKTLRRAAAGIQVL